MHGRRSALHIVLLAAVWVSAVANAQSTEATHFAGNLREQPVQDIRAAFDYGDTRWALADRMAHHHVPGVAVALIQQGELRWVEGWGTRRNGLDAPVSAATLFEAGSATKLLTAVLALRGVEQGWIGLDDAVNNALTRWHVPDRGEWSGNAVTLRQLLSHTAGINRPDGLFSYEPGTAPTLQDVLNGQPPAINEAVALEAAPGIRHRYSNLGYLVVQQLLEDVTGLPYARLMAEQILDPLAMTGCGFEFPFGTSLQNRVADPHTGDGEPGAHDLHPTALAHGGLLCSAEELGTFLAALLRSASIDAAGLLKPATLNAMLQPQHPVEDFIGGFDGQGLGLFTIGAGDHLYFAHHGYNVPGTAAFLIAHPATRNGAVFLANGANGFPLIFEMLAAVIDQYRWPSMDAGLGGMAP